MRIAGEKERSVAAETVMGWRPRAHLKLSRLLLPRNYFGKVLLVTLIGILLPKVALLIYLFRIVQIDLAEAWPGLLVALGATLLGAGCVLLVLRALLAPVAIATRALRLARLGRGLPTLPTDLDDEGGRLLAETQHTLHHFDAVIKRLELEAATDELTGTLNRRAGERRLRAALGASHQSGHQLAVVLLDVDGLKRVNDRWGHAAGDAALAHLASTLIQHVGVKGWVARWGGDEFLVVLVEAGEREQTETVLASVARNVAAAPLPVVGAGDTRLGVSWGLARAMPGEGTANVVERADAALYSAKQRSRMAPPR